jgi:Low psii accumulation1 / Rep27
VHKCQFQIPTIVRREQPAIAIRTESGKEKPYLLTMMPSHWLLVITLVASWISEAAPFQIAGSSTRPNGVRRTLVSTVLCDEKSHLSIGSYQCRLSSAIRQSRTVLFGNDDKKKDGLDSKVRTKLLAESIAPWRTVRLYFYGGFGISAFVGGLITLSAVVAAMGGSRPDVDLNEQVRLSTTSYSPAPFMGYSTIFASSIHARHNIDQEFSH